jgi:hypothetical protein
LKPPNGLEETGGAAVLTAVSAAISAFVAAF